MTSMVSAQLVTRTRPRSAAGPPVVVIGIDNITGLQTARIFAERGVPVIGLAADTKHWGARTRSCVEIFQTPLAEAALLDTLHDLVARRPGPHVLFPCTDLSVAYLSRHRAALPLEALLPLSPHPTVELLLDKTSFAAHAASTGLPVPRTTEVHNPAEVAAAATVFDFPCVLKPGVKTADWLAHTRAKGFLVHDRDELLERYASLATWAPQLLLQEWVSGPQSEQYTCNAYFKDGEALVTFVTRKMRQWPPTVGTGSSGEECRNDDVVEATLKLFGDVGFEGLAYLELKRNLGTGRLMIIEPNVGRPTGRSATAEAAGVELLLTAYRDALGLPLPEARTQLYQGMKWVDLRRDAQSALVACRAGTLSPREWAHWLRGPKAHAIWSRRDPVPFAVDLVQASRAGGRMLAARLPRDRSTSPSAEPVSVPTSRESSVAFASTRKDRAI